jgi:hypothetical protein
MDMTERMRGVMQVVNEFKVSKWFLERENKALKAELAHIRENYTICEKEPEPVRWMDRNGTWHESTPAVPLYREAK